MKTLIILFALLLCSCAGNHGFFYERSYWSPTKWYYDACADDIYKVTIGDVTYIRIGTHNSYSIITKQEYLDMVDRMLAKGSINQRTANCMKAGL